MGEWFSFWIFLGFLVLALYHIVFVFVFFSDVSSFLSFFLSFTHWVVLVPPASKAVVAHLCELT
jgi:hypothetical protein